jgi:hypothetical protein
MRHPPLQIQQQTETPIYFCATCRSGIIHLRGALNEKMQIDKNDGARKAGPPATQHFKFNCKPKHHSTFAPPATVVSSIFVTR